MQVVLDESLHVRSWIASYIRRSASPALGTGRDATWEVRRLRREVSVGLFDDDEKTMHR